MSWSHLHHSLAKKSWESHFNVNSVDSSVPGYISIWWLQPEIGLSESVRSGGPGSVLSGGLIQTLDNGEILSETVLLVTLGSEK